MDRKEESKKYKYLFVINNLCIGGAEKLVVDQINYFYKSGFQVGLLTLVKSEKLNFTDKLILPIEDQFFINANFNLKSVWKVFLFLKKYKAQIIFSHLFLSNTIVRLATLFLLPKPKLVIFEHNNYEKEKTNKHLLIDRLLSFVTFKIIAVSESVRAYLLRSGINNKKIALLKNGVDFSFANKALDLRAKKKSLNIDSADKIIVAVGNVSLQKGYDILIEAASKIINQQNNVLFLICGNNNNDLYQQLATKIRQENLQNKILFLGSRSDVLEIVALADVFVMPSRWEGLSIALLEAMALAKAIVVSDIESMRLVLKDQADCLMFHNGDYNDLVAKISDCLADQDLRIKLGAAALKNSYQYSIENNVDNLLKIVSE